MIQGNEKTITLASNFLLSSDTNDINNTIIDGSQPQNPTYGMCVMFKNQDSILQSRIIGFTIEKGTGYYGAHGGGVFTQSATATIEFNHIQNCTVTGNSPDGAGIRIGNSSGDTSKVCYIRNNVIRNCTIANADAQALGAGITLFDVSAVIEGNQLTHNIITGDSNAVSGGGGICFIGNSNAFHNPYLTIKDNLLSYNEVLSGLADGGGIDISTFLLCKPVSVIEGNTITQNQVRSNATVNVDGYATGGGIYLLSADQTTITGNVISDNSVMDSPDSWGGGIFIERDVTAPVETMPLVEKNRIAGNDAREGGAIHCKTSGVRLINNLMTENTATNLGGAVSINWLSAYDLPSEIINNTMTANTVTAPGGIAGSVNLNGLSSTLLMNNIFYNNNADNEISINETTVGIYNCNVDGTKIIGAWTGNGNFPGDPCFCDGDYQIGETSCCEDAGLESVEFGTACYYAPLIDRLDSPRPWHLGFDIGSDECDVITKLPDSHSAETGNPFVVVRPNPFSDFTTLEYELELPGEVTFIIYNNEGQRVDVLVNEFQSKGQHMVQWNAEGLPAGIYFYELRAEGVGQSAVSGQRSAVGKLVKF
jgi:hypothetical protein